MADAKGQMVEREYIIPLRRIWLRVPKYERTGKAIKAIKQFIAKHMKVPDRDIEKVKLDVYFNNELWFRGRAHPPAKIKVRAMKEGDIVKVDFSEIPEYVAFLKTRHDKFKKKASEKVAEEKTEEKPAEAKTEERTEEQKVTEQEKEKALEQQQIKQAEQQQRAEKHITKVKEPKIQRMALKK